MGDDVNTGEGNAADGDEEALSVLQKVAILMVAIGQDASGQVLKFLSDYEIEEVTQAVADLKTVSPKVIDLVLEDFENFLLAGEYLSQGGADFAREILERVNTKVSSGFYILKNVAPQQIAPFISNEHPQTIALILSQLEPDQAAGILSHLSERIQAEVAYRIAAMENITPNVLKQIEESLEASLRDILGGNQDVGGPKVVADILNLTGSSVEKSVLDLIDSTDPEVAEEVRNLMFVFADLVKLTDKEIQVLLREADQKDLTIALKSAEEELKEKVLGNMPERVRQFIQEEMDFLGPMRLSEVEEVQLRIVQLARHLEEQGQITITRGDANEQFV